MFLSSVSGQVCGPISCVIAHVTPVLNSVMFRCLVNFQYVRRECLIITFVAQEETFSLMSGDFVLFQHAQFTGHIITLIALILLDPVLHPTPSLVFSGNVSSQSFVTTGHEATEVTRQPIL